MRSYKDHLRAIGRKPLPKNLRTPKKAGEVEIAWDSEAGEYVAHRHEGEEVGNVVPFVRRKRA